MPTLSTPPGTAQLAFTLELVGWESYPVDEHGEFMTGRSPEERAASPFRKYSNEWIEYRVVLEMLDQIILEGHGTPPSVNHQRGWRADIVQRIGSR